MRALAGHLAVLALLSLPLACSGPASPELRIETTPAGAPQVAAFDPPDGATDVDPARAALSVTFDREMDPEGWAWVVESRETAPELGASAWDATGRTNTVATTLEPGHDYVLWINSSQFAYFRSPDGQPATPRRWSFSTAGTPREAAAVAKRTPSVPGAPRVVALDPPNGATDVDPALSRLQVTFDRAMGDGWSWVIETRDLFPQTAGPASMSDDRQSAFLPVRLEPGKSYVVWLNGADYHDFRDTAGRPLPPLRWTFATRPES